jgi:hypothetical protein
MARGRDDCSTGSNSCGVIHSRLRRVRRCTAFRFGIGWHGRRRGTVAPRPRAAPSPLPERRPLAEARYRR